MIQIPKTLYTVCEGPNFLFLSKQEYKKWFLEYCLKKAKNIDEEMRHIEKDNLECDLIEVPAYKYTNIPTLKKNHAHYFKEAMGAQTL